MWSGPDLPYICHLDFIDSRTNLQLNQPSSSFYVTQAAGSPSKIWSADNASQALQMGSASSSSASTAPTATPAGNPVSSSTSTPTAKSDQGAGISVGGIVGIVIAALVGGGLIAGAAVFFWLRRRRNQQTENPAWQDQGYQRPPGLRSTHHGFFGYAEKDGQEPTPEMSGRTFTELDGTTGRK